MDAFDLHYYLEQEFKARKKRNSRYSLRSFAAHLNIDASQLSKTLKYKHGLTTSFAEKILPHLSIEETTKDKLLQQIVATETSKKGRHKTSREYFIPEPHAKGPFKNKNEIAVLVAMSIPIFNKNLKSIQEILGLSDHSFKEALLSLESQELIKKCEDGYELIVRQVSDLPHTPTNILKAQIQKEFLRSALKSLEYTPAEKRLNGTLTMSFDESLIPQAKDKIYNFMKDFNAWAMSEGSSLNNIYNMTMAFFPLTAEKELE